MNKAVMVLENGQVFTGQAFGATGRTLGEAVFCTAMTGYQETLTDPSYHRQIVVATAPQIGNTGWNTEDSESLLGKRSSVRWSADFIDHQDPGKIWVAGYAVRNPTRRVSNWRAGSSLEDELIGQGVVGIAGIDTRALVRVLRDSGSMRAGIFSGDAIGSTEEMLDAVRAQPSMAGADLAAQVSTSEPYIVEAAGGEAKFTVAALDMGIKANTPRMLAARGVEVHVLPSDATYADIRALNPDGFFLSNGPGDPATADAAVALTSEVIDAGLPTFGICFGNQILGRAFGRSTYKLKFGHRGINIPVLDTTTGRVAITSQNHGFALEGEAGEEFDTDLGRARVSHVCANDGVVEGVELLSGQAFSVQYHPEAASGPHDAANLFDKFVNVMENSAMKGTRA
ncbi:MULTISPECIES: glutamine-hydrolyzing carbamoyl-phosphate synthase small subunit [Gordonia]|uniref:Carbamoyl phosphate synthase small chain n=2 Tax=Gordonia TaxID=2053 RepID=L7LEL3_9ACTN|nr:MULTISPECIES: glutamine-hydrolyzing carbamoyl-phosphate synthase small subunit [Gordonia]AUH69102.1 carbamoyl-phosphate synthase small subunit [Gordonia sp. YC-JH1]KJR06671.1 carbamoyl phosphate synthase small subunit [Gordonia sihwensis]KXT56888.1 carbamoyl phosphate synthase small subunit [Gordonia sp. QH-12]MBY4568661.1 carbamoyl phosphate synthase small subunit [Gordonia sihwensis]WFN94618.1 glutamine-hydrolyzing carbamoyl-phosphate synthase small subunit [Gordonia sihwensis]